MDFLFKLHYIIGVHIELMLVYSLNEVFFLKKTCLIAAFRIKRRNDLFSVRRAEFNPFYGTHITI